MIEIFYRLFHLSYQNSLRYMGNLLGHNSSRSGNSLGSVRLESSIDRKLQWKREFQLSATFDSYIYGSLIAYISLLHSLLRVFCSVHL